MKIGFIGLGNVGGKLAASLLRNKFDLTVRDLETKLTNDFKNNGAKVSDSAKELAEQTDLIITCLPSPKVCADVMESPEADNDPVKITRFYFPHPDWENDLAIQDMYTADIRKLQDLGNFENVKAWESKQAAEAARIAVLDAIDIKITDPS